MDKKVHPVAAVLSILFVVVFGIFYFTDAAQRCKAIFDDFAHGTRGTTAGAVPMVAAAPFPASAFFPLPTNTPFLTTAPTMPETTAPVVYVAFALDPDNRLTSASEMFTYAVRTQLRSQATDKLCINLLPNAVMGYQFIRSFQPFDIASVDREQSLLDARELGADYTFIPAISGNDENLTVSVEMIDMRSSRTVHWSADNALSADATITSKVIETAAACARFAGVSDKEIDDNGMRLNAPSPATFNFLAFTKFDPANYEKAEKVALADPDCIEQYMRNLGTTTPVQLVSEGLKRFPNDPRLLIFKGQTLTGTGNATAGLCLLSEVVRRYPDMLFPMGNMLEAANDVFLQEEDAQKPPVAWVAINDYLKSLTTRFPDNYFAWWDRASSLCELADVIRGTQTSEKIPGAIWKKRFELAEDALRCINRSRSLSPKNPSLLQTLIYYHWQNEEQDLDMQQALIDTLHKMDPRNTEAEVRAIRSHTVGYDNLANFLRMFDAAVKNHSGDARALAALVPELYTELCRQVGWKRVSEDDAYVKPNPLSRRFLESAKKVYAGGFNLMWYGDNAYHKLVESQEPALLDQWRKDPQNSWMCFALAYEAHEKSDWQLCHDLAERALPDMTLEEKKQMCYYLMTDSLGEMKKEQETLDMARAAIMKWPQVEGTFYMYASQANKAGLNLETAFECARRGLEINNADPQCNDIYMKLRKRLGKP